MERSRRVLEVRDPAALVGANRENRLDGVRLRVDVLLARRDHPDDRTEQRNVLPDDAHLADDADVARDLVIREDGADVLADRVTSVDHAPVEIRRACRPS